MGKLNWTIEDLKTELNRNPLIKGWMIREEFIHRRERYFLQENQRLEIDQDRNVRSQNLSAKIFVRQKKPGRQGEISKKLFRTLPLSEQIQSAVNAALQTDHQSWELPQSIPQSLPKLQTTDPRMAEDLDRVMHELTERVSASVQKKRMSTFNSAELFLSVHDRTLYLSNGLVDRSSQSRIYTEAAFSHAKKDTSGRIKSDEYLSTFWAVHLDQLPIEKIFDEAAERAEHSLDIEKPKTGSYSVLIDSEVISTLLNGFISQLWASHAYQGLPFIQKDQEFIPNAQGDLLSITLDPTLNYGADTTALSSQGLAQNPLQLVLNNRVLSTATDQQYANYLGTSPTTSRGNLVIAPGSLSYTELTQAAPQVLEILQFSGLFADPNTGTFSSEIRLAKLYNRESNQVTYIKGGSLSGSIRDNFKGLKLSKSTTQRSHFSSDQPEGQGYAGPEYALLSEVSIVG